MKRFLNMRSNYGVETVDSLYFNEFKQWDEIISLSPCEQRKAFQRELNRLISEYRLAGMNVYSSQRPVKDY